MFTAALVTIASIWKQPECPLADECLKNMWPIYTMEYYSALTRKKILTQKTSWINLEANMLSEINQS